MSLRRQASSPTARLLRNSRLFSIPNPLPRPLVAEPHGSGSIRASDTATIPYPTHQAIATTPKSLARGDWGLKRPLPTRSRQLQGSDPVVRVTQWDTIEHVTDFESAADHVRTRQKFEEMSVPMMKGMGKLDLHDQTYLGPPPKSAFEKGQDVTSYETDEGMDGAGLYLNALKKSMLERRKNESPFSPPEVSAHDIGLRPNERWRHDGPWLPGMSAGEFATYVTEQLSHRRAEFNKYLSEYVKGQIYTTRSNAAQSETIPMDPIEAEQFQAERQQQWSTITRADIEAEIRSLRAQCAVDPLNSKLVKNLIIPFLRLPPIKLKDTTYSAERSGSGLREKFADDTTPNSTHPSAGLGYLRTNAYLSNHPILGPQEKHTPVIARVVQPSRTATTTESHARLGVAGFITNDSHRQTDGRSRNVNRDVKSFTALDVETEGGAKVSVQAQFAAVSPDGKVHIKINQTHGADVNVARGELSDRPPMRDNVEVNPIADLGFGKSGVPELDAQSSGSAPTSAQKEELFDFLKTQSQSQKADRDSAGTASPRSSAPRQQTVSESPDWAALLNPGSKKN